MPVLSQRMRSCARQGAADALVHGGALVRDLRHYRPTGYVPLDVEYARWFGIGERYQGLDWKCGNPGSPANLPRLNLLPADSGQKFPQCFEGCSKAGVSATRGDGPESAFSRAVFSRERQYADLLTLDKLLILRREFCGMALTFASFFGYREGLESNSCGAVAVTVWSVDGF